MELAALFAKLFGPTFARILFAYALRGKVDWNFITGGDLAETLADSLDIGGAVDRLSDGDRTAKRNASFVFETIGDEVAERVAVLFVGENAAPEAGEMEQAGEAAKAVMNRRGLALLIQTRFDRIAFRRELSATPPPAPGWSTRQRDYYSRLLAISADALFAAAEQLPHFTRDTTAQLLQDTGHLLAEMRRGLENQQQILAQSYGHQRRDERAQFEQDYRTALANALDRLRLFGVEKVDGARQPLSVAFVRMRLAHTQRDEEDLPGFGKPGRSDARSQILSVAEAFGRGKRLVVAAPAGLGKTTLLRWAAVQMARRRWDGEFSLWEGRIPFFVQLRDYSQSALPAIADLPLAYRGDGMELLAGSAPAGWAGEQLRQGSAAIFVDGLDEINEAKRQEALTWVEELLAMQPETLFVLSGRPAALDQAQTQPELSRLGFAFVSLQPLDEERIDAFVAQWHAAMAHNDCKYPDKSRIPQREARLAAALRQRPELRHLAATPLLAAMLCALNLTEERELPRDRIRLYNRCVDMLLDRDTARGVDTSDFGVNLRPDSARLHLGHIAFWMLEEDKSAIDRTDAVQLIASHGFNGEKIASYLAERTGLLQPQSQEVYDFAHRTLQEFLAAQHIATTLNAKRVVRHYAGQKEWRETISLLAGFVRPEEQKEVLEILLDAAQKKPDEARSYHLLAWAFWELLDQRTAEANGLMARHAAGLCRDNGRTLDLNSTPVGDVTPLAGLTSLQELYMRNTQVGDVTPLAGLASLQELYLSETQVGDVSPLAGLTRLQRLNLGDTQVGDVTPLAGLTRLQYLYLSDTQVGDVTPLAGLTRLQTLYLNDTQVGNVTPLAGLSSLQSLYLWNTQVGDVTPLAGLTGLQRLYLSSTQVGDVSALAGLSSLQELYLSDTQVGNVSPLAGLTGLQYLDLSSTQVWDVSPLAGLRNLHTLYLSSTQVWDLAPLAGLIASGQLVIELTKEQIAYMWEQLQNLTGLGLRVFEVEALQLLAGLTSLRELDLSHTQVADLTPLAGLTSLQALDLSLTKVEEVTVLAKLVCLRELEMRAIPVADVTPLAGLVGLQELYLSSTQLTDLVPLKELTGLQALDLSYTPVADVTPLVGLTSLKVLYLNDTAVADVTPLAGLTSLQYLYLSDTRVTDVSALDHLENLRIVR